MVIVLNATKRQIQVLNTSIVPLDSDEHHQMITEITTLVSFKKFQYSKTGLYSKLMLCLSTHTDERGRPPSEDDD